MAFDKKKPKESPKEILKESPEKVKYTGPVCPRCDSKKVRQISAQREAAESKEPTHRKVVGVRMISSIYACPCGKRFYVK